MERDEGRLAALLCVAGGRAISDREIRVVKTAVMEWRRGDKALANIRLAQAGLPRVRDIDEAWRLHRAEQLLDKDVRPDEMLRALGLGSLSPGVAKYEADQPRVPAGNGRASGQWASGAAAGEGAGSAAQPVEGRSAVHAPSGEAKPVDGAAPDGTPVTPAANADDPRLNKQARDAARAAGLTTPEELDEFHDAITGQGIVDFQELVDIARTLKKPKPP